MESVRTQFLNELVVYGRNSAHSLTVVFDGWRDGKGHEAKSVYGGVTVIYSGLGEKADSVIKRIISTERRKWIVISSDREIESFAWRMACVPIRSHLFREALDRSIGEPEDHSEVEGPPFGKRRSQGKMSRKEREIYRVLNKL